MTQNYPRLVNAIVSDRSYATKTQNKRFGVSIQGLPQSVPQKTYNVSDTEIRFNQTGCWKPQQDCAWFLGTALSQCDVEVCQLGDRDLSGSIVTVRNHGKVRYTTHAGAVRRGTVVFDSGTITTSLPPTPTIPFVSIVGGTEATGFTISVATDQPVDTVVYLNRTYTGIFTGFFNDSLTVTILAGSLSVNLPFGDRRTVASFGNITVVIDVNGRSYISSNGSNTATIIFP